MMRTRFVLLLAAALWLAWHAVAAVAQECGGGDCYGDGACYGDCYGDGGCDGAGGHCGHGGLFGGHHAGGCKGPCYWCGGCGACGGGGGCCYGNCGLTDCGYMLPIRRAQWYNWNRNYAYTDYGQPTALVVPPTANMQTNWGWGVASSRISRIDHQFQRNYAGGGPFGGRARPTPVWPSDTSQWGVYYVRGPW